MNKIDRIHELVIELNQYRHEYYNLAKPTVSDLMYDTLFDELSKLEKETGLVLSVSPTQQVGYTVVSKLNKVTHTVPLLSLDKTKSINDIIKFKGDRDIIVMLKADGLTVKLDYDNGILQQGSTRGNSIIGEDITNNVRQFKNIPLTIPYKGKLTIVGEAIIHYDDFEKINSTLPESEKYKNPRNLTSGSVRQLDSKECANRHVNFYAFGILECEEELSDSKYERFKWLGQQGFFTIINNKIGASFDTPEYQLEIYMEQLKHLAKNLHIPTDGIVASFDSVEYSNTLKSTSHHPLHSLAYKFEDESESTILTGIEWSLGKTSTITPVALFEDVILDGTTVSRASLHNISIMEELELGIGDTINIIKANCIIPMVTDNLTRSNNIIIPTHCPVCDGLTEIKQDNQSKVLICTNDSCDGKFLKKLSHFVSRDAMNIDGLSEATLEKFMDATIINNSMSDIFTIENWKSLIVNMEGMGNKSYEKLIKAIDNAKETEMYRVIYSMSIPNIGRTASKSIAKYFNYDIDKFLEAIDSKFNFTILEDFGETMHNSIYTWFNKNRNEFNDVLGYVNIKKPDSKKDNNVLDNPFRGKKVYGTGTFANYKKEELKTLLESLGAEFSSGYAKSLDYLIVGSIKGSSKEAKAIKDGVPILFEDDFIKMIK